MALGSQITRAWFQIRKPDQVNVTAFKKLFVQFKRSLKTLPFVFIAPAEAFPALRPCAPRPPSLCCGRGLEHSVAESEHAGQMSGSDQLESALRAALGLSSRLGGSGKV